MILHRRSVLGLVLLAAATAAIPGISFAQTSDAAKFVQELGNKAIAQLAGKQMAPADEQALFRQILDELFDVPRIGAFTAGSYWRTATDPQKQEFLGLFETQIVNAYAKRFQAYSGQQFKVTTERKEGDTDTVVSSQIVQPNGGPPVNVDWRVRQEPSGSKVVDVTIEGISMSVTQRQEYSAVIERGGGTFDALLTAMKSQAAPVAAVPAKS